MQSNQALISLSIYYSESNLIRVTESTSFHDTKQRERFFPLKSDIASGISNLQH